LQPAGDIRACPYYYAYADRRKQVIHNYSIGYEKNARLTIFNNTDRWVRLITVERYSLGVILKMS